MDVVYFGSGAFGVPTLTRLAAEHRVLAVLTQPDRPAGRHRLPRPTPVAEAAAALGLPVERPPEVNQTTDVVERLRRIRPGALVVIAYGQKLGPDLLEVAPAFNLHASLLPRYRGAAPIARAIMQGERETGLSVIAMTARIDAGDVVGQRATTIDPAETAGELEERLSRLGPDLIMETLALHGAGRLCRTPQDPALVSLAPKLSRQDGLVDFDRPAAAVRCHIHGVTPWPGCRVRLGESEIAILRAADLPAPGSAGSPGSPGSAGARPGTLCADLTVACRPGAGVLRLLDVQPAGGKPMKFEAFCRGHHPRPGQKLEPM